MSGLDRQFAHRWTNQGYMFRKTGNSERWHCLLVIRRTCLQEDWVSSFCVVTFGYGVRIVGLPCANYDTLLPSVFITICFTIWYLTSFSSPKEHQLGNFYTIVWCWITLTAHLGPLQYSEFPGASKYHTWLQVCNPHRTPPEDFCLFTWGPVVRCDFSTCHEFLCNWNVRLSDISWNCVLNDWNIRV